MPNIYFKVGDTDYSQNVIGENYQVHKEPQFVAWTDANGREHRSVYRDQITGSFSMLFESLEAYELFCTHMAANMQNDTSYHCTVFENKTNTEVISDFFITYTPTRRVNDQWQDVIDVIKVTIKER